MSEGRPGPPCTNSEERWGNEQRSADADWRGSERLLDKLGHLGRGEVDFVAYLSLLSSLRASCSGRRRANPNNSVLHHSVLD